jgi:peptide/nickel transport system ATP-binding protein
MSSVLTVENLTVEVASRHGTSRILSDVSFSVDAGEVFGLVGESGCGKSTLALAIMRYLPESMKVVSGRIMFNGQNVLELSARETRRMRSRGVAMVYQDPMASLNPVMKIGPQLVEVLTNQDSHSATEARRQAVQMLREVRLPDPDQIMDRYPFQLSGGQQQRVVIAMALISNPSLIIMDEPTTGLDATIEAAILELINDLRKRMGMAVLFISHNLRAVRHVSQRLAVLYAGRIVETGEAEEVFSGAAHPYTQGLLRALPSLSRPHGGRLQSIPGTLSSSDRDTVGCAFFSRCNFGLRDVCTGTSIIPRKVGPDEQHLVSCARLGVTQSDPVFSSGNTETSTANLPADSKLLTVQGLSKTYKIAGSFGRRASSVQALSDISLDLSS